MVLLFSEEEMEKPGSELRGRAPGSSDSKVSSVRGEVKRSRLFLEGEMACKWWEGWEIGRSHIYFQGL
jgi:hypothetical protein